MGTGAHILAHILVVHAHSSHALMSRFCRVRNREKSQQPLSLARFSCHVFGFSEVTSEKYFTHINLHLKENETVPCMFKGCTFRTNI